MIVLSMAYTVLVSAGVCIGAAIAELVFRRGRISTRYVWVAALCLASSAAWRSVDRTTDEFKHSRTSPQDSHPFTWQDQVRTSASAVWAPHVVTVPVTDTSRARKIESTFVAFWVASSLLTLAMFSTAAWRLRRIRSRAQPANIGEVHVLLTPSVGPLVVGALHPRIVLPNWVLSLDPDQVELVVAHEAEHLRARDPLLLTLGALAVSLAPWNPLLWYALRKLREAVEIDCDQRVLAKRPDVRAYGGLLLSVASRSPARLVPATGLSASVSSLERRLTLMKDTQGHNKPYRILSGLAIAVVVVIATAMVPRPVPLKNAGANLSDASQSRATGRVRVSGVAEHGYRVYTTGGGFSVVNKPNVTKKDVNGGLVADLASTGDIFDVDVTGGPIHFEAKDHSSLHVEAAMGGSSPAAWLTGTGGHLILDQGGTGLVLSVTVPASRLNAVRLDPNTSRQDPNTFFEFQVDTPAIDTVRVSPAYSEALRTSGLSGDVWTQFVVDETGQVEMKSFKALKSPGPAFTSAVLAVLPQWRFRAAKLHGKPVRQVVQLAFEFAKTPLP